MARDPNRVGPFLAALQDLWIEHPDQRFGQLIENVIRTGDYDLGYLWTLEEDQWLLLIERAQRVWREI